MTSKTDEEPYGPKSKVAYADPGYQKDGKARYPINTAPHVRAANAYLNVASNAAKYTPAQVKRMKSKIKTAAKKFGIDIAKESADLAQEITELLEAYASSCFDNGAASISVSGYTDDAGKLAALGQRLALAAQGALYIVDPDCDGDVDLTMPDGSTDSSSSPSPSEADNDNDMSPAQCTSCSLTLPTAALFCPTCGQPVPNAESDDSAPIPETEEATVPTDETTESAETSTEEAAPERKMTDADVAALGTMLAGLLKPAVEAAPAPEAPAVEAAPVTETPAAPAVAETFTAEQVAEQIKEAAEAAAKTARDEAIAEAVETFRAAGGGRKGLMATPVIPGQTQESAGDTLDAAAMAKLSTTEFRDRAWEAWSSGNLPGSFMRKIDESSASYGA